MPDFELLSLLSGGIVGGFIGAFLGGFTKFLWEHWVPSRLTWQRQQQIDRDKFLSQFRDPVMRATADLQNRIYSILVTDNIAFLKKEGRIDYYINSTAFLVAQFFAWVEILRRKADKLDYSELVARLDAVSQAFAYGGPGFQIFHLEQREIGERIIITSSGQDERYQTIGYSDFVDRMKESNIPTCFIQLDKHVRALMDNPDLPKNRLIKTQNALIDLMDFIDPHFQWVSKDKRTKVK